MKKIIVVNEALTFRRETLDLAAFVARLGRSKLVGVFFDEDKLDTVPSIRSLGGQLYVEEIAQTKEARTATLSAIRKASEQFTSGCIQREVDSIVRHYKGDIVNNIVKESRYADLLIVPSALSPAGDTNVPSKLLMEILHGSECPVIVAPDHFEVPAEIVLAYDGSRSAAFAIKQFYYQLPELADRKVIVLHVNTDGENTDQDDENDHFIEWLDLHYPNLSFHESNGDAREGLFKYFIEYNQQKDKLLVIGSFGRSMLSSFFKKSAADLVLKAIDAPVFVAHF